MNTTKQVQFIKLLNAFVLILSSLQLMLPMAPIIDPYLSIISALVMFGTTGLTAYKQYISKEIDNNALYPTVILALVALLVGIIDVLGTFNLSSNTSQWIRFGITFIAMVLNIVSKTYFPTGEARNVCNAIIDTETGLYLKRWNSVTQTATWGTDLEGLCMDEIIRASILATLNNGGSRYAGAVIPSKGF